MYNSVTLKRGLTVRDCESATLGAAIISVPLVTQADAPKKDTDVVPKPTENDKETATTKPKKDADAIPLYDGSRVYVSKVALARAYIPMPAIYTSRVTDLVIGKETLAKIARGEESPDKELLEAIIIEIKMEEQSPTPGLSTDAAVASLAVTYLSDDESFRKPFTLPKILDGKFYKNIQPNQKTPGAIQATCTTCYGLISGTTKSTGNFLSHIKRRHKELLPLCQLYCQAKANGSVPPAIKHPILNPNTVVTSTTPTLEMMTTQVTQMQPPPTYATTATHLAMPVTVPVSMSLAMPLSLPSVQTTPQMMALMQQHQAHGAVFISKDY